MPQYLGRNQIAECMRSGAKCYAKDLVRDGRNPSLLVLPEWADPMHPQERPYIPDDIEGAAEWPMAPDNLPPTNLMLSGSYYAGGHQMGLVWNQATLWGPRAKTYTLRRSTDGGAYSDISVNLVDYTNITGHDTSVGVVKDYGHVYFVATTYTDSTPLDNHIYTYQVAAVDDVGDDVATSNIVTLNTFTNTVTGNSSLTPPVIAYTALLLHMDGVDAGTVFVDSSPLGLTSDTSPFGPTHLQPIFGAQTSTTHPLYGTAAFSGGAGGGALRVINNNIITALPSLYYPLDGQDFTIEMAFYKPATEVGTAALWSMSNFNNGAQTFIDVLVNQVNGFLNVLVKQSDGVTVVINFVDNQNLCNAGYHQIALVRSGLTYSIYVGGVRRFTTTLGAGLGAMVIGDIAIGRQAGSSGGSAMTNGWIDEVRFTQGLARYSGASYTPAVGPFTG